MTFCKNGKMAKTPADCMGPVVDYSVGNDKKESSSFLNCSPIT